MSKKAVTRWVVALTGIGSTAGLALAGAIAGLALPGRRTVTATIPHRVQEVTP